MERCSFFAFTRRRYGMYRRRLNFAFTGVLSVLLVLFITPADASTPGSETKFESIPALRNYIQQEMEHYFQKRYPELELGDSLLVDTGHLDNRLQLLKCNEKPQLQVKAPPHRSTNVTVKASCSRSTRWSIYVPVKIETYEDVLVAAHSLARGTLLEDSDLTFQRVNTSTLSGGPLTDPTRIIGLELKRPLRPMDMIQLNQVKQPEIISRGETVVLQVKTAMLTVQTEGTALSSGTLGEKIKVRNESSRRIVDGLVTAPGEVEVSSY